MRILIATTYVPFARNPGLIVVEQLRAELTARGFTAEIAALPFTPDWSKLPDQTAAVRLLDLSESCGNRIDRLITVRYPAFALKHPNKVAWFTPPAAEGGWSDTSADRFGRHHSDVMRRSDTAFLRECRGVFTTSWAAAERVRRVHRVEPHGILYPPLPPGHTFRPGRFGDYLLSSAVTPLAVQALAFTDPEVKLVLVGEPDPAVRERVQSGGWGHRVTFAGAVPAERRAELLAGSCGLVHLAPAGDPFGLAAVEAFHAHKPILTLIGAGGNLELVQDGVSGFVAPPVPAAVAAGMTRLWRDREEGERLGLAGHATLARAGIHWDGVVRGLAS